MTLRATPITSAAVFGNSFAGRSVFVTGHTGFKGSWLSIWLHRLGARVFGYSRGVPSRPSNFVASGVGELLAGHTDADVRSREELQAALEAANPDVVFHLAAQPLVRASYQSPHETFDVNFMGTCNLLEAIRMRGKPCAVVVVTSDKCYENVEAERPYSEEDAMGGHDPYSASKGAAELLVGSYRRSFFEPARVHEHGVTLASARAGNVIGGGDWARDRIVPDIVACLVGGRSISVRSPQSVRPWQHVLEPISGYLQVAGRMLTSGGNFCSGWNFGPDENGATSVGDLVEQFCEAWGAGDWVFTGKRNQPHEARLLQLSIEKAKCELGWRPVWSLREAVRHTVQWYREFHDVGGSMLAACVRDIEDYSGSARLMSAGATRRTGVAA